MKGFKVAFEGLMRYQKGLKENSWGFKELHGSFRGLSREFQMRFNEFQCQAFQGVSERFLKCFEAFQKDSGVLRDFGRDSLLDGFQGIFRRVLDGFGSVSGSFRWLNTLGS